MKAFSGPWQRRLTSALSMALTLKGRATCQLRDSYLLLVLLLVGVVLLLVGVVAMVGVVVVIGGGRVVGYLAYKKTHHPRTLS